MSRPTIKVGSTGPDVVYCQERLTVHGYATSADGIFGSGTDTNVRQFQNTKGLTVDGIVGTNTWAALDAAPEEDTVLAYEDLTELDRRMLCEIAQYIGWDYTQNTASLVALPCRLAPSNVVWAKGKKTDTVCCVLVGGVVGRVYDKLAKWTSTAWQRFMVQYADQPWSMCEEAVAAGIGKWYTGVPQAGRWYIVQKWKNLVNGKVVPGTSSGHQWLQWGPDLLVEANTYTDEDADGSSTDEGAVAWRHRAWNHNANDVRLVELNPF